MTFYVCKNCNYKHTFLPLVCAKCKGTNFYPLVTSEPTGNTDVCNGMEIQEDVLKLRIVNEQLRQENNNLLDVINNYEVKIADLEKQIEKMRDCLKRWYEQKSEKFTETFYDKLMRDTEMYLWNEGVSK